MTIEHIETSELAAIVAGLVREGVTFEARPSVTRAGCWRIVLTGGF